ncbi:hypothetical protein HY501_02220 [Candidatus Woesearchaeota archaeon]|nr:hypothetical protein [Candidatus Woesearchaeota archaeon]
MAKNLDKIISSDEIGKVLKLSRNEDGLEEFATELNAILLDVYKSDRLRDAIKKLGKPITLFQLEQYNDKHLELRPDEYMAVVLHDAREYVPNTVIPVTVREGMLYYEGMRFPLAKSILINGSNQELVKIPLQARTREEGLRMNVGAQIYTQIRCMLADVC